METALIIIASVAAIAAIAAAFGSWRTPAPPPPSDFSDTERRLREEFERMRAGFDAALREVAQSGAGAQKDLALQITKQLNETGAQLVAGLSEASAGGRRELAATLDKNREAQTAAFSALAKDQRDALDFARRAQDERLAAIELAFKASIESFTKAMGELRTLLVAETGTMREGQQRAFAAMQEGIATQLAMVRQDNEAKLEKIRATVEEKLQSTLEARLGDSFRLVSERLEEVHRGFGEMRSLAKDTGDLKRVLTNVRSRGTFGEVQLEALLEQVLTPQQFERNVATKSGSNDRVEFAIKLPGRGEDREVVYLPIDAKFPQEDYMRLQEAYETGDVERLEKARVGLRAQLVGEAKTISSKYLDPPHTTDFAILFVPTEGLFAEALRLPGLSDELQGARVTLAGPTTLYALLNSLQMGFRTLAIEKRSSEVWKVLAGVKTEFGKFGEALDAVGKKLQEAQNKIEDVAVRRRAMNRSLRDVEALPDHQAPDLFPADSEE